MPGAISTSPRKGAQLSGGAHGFQADSRPVVPSRRLDQLRPVGLAVAHLGVREVRHPVRGHPADVVGVQVRQQQGVDVLGSDSGLAQGQRQPAARAHVAVVGLNAFGEADFPRAEPGVDQDRPPAAADQVCARGRVDRAVRRDDLGMPPDVESRKEGRRQPDPAVGQRMDLDVPHLDGPHALHQDPHAPF
jgi:hypothetical protein